SSLALTRELAAMGATNRLLLYVTGRPEAEAALADGTTAALTTDLVRLGPLDDIALTALMGSVLEGRPPTRFVPFVKEPTGGNPFFVEELTRSLKETGAIHLQDGMWITSVDWDATQCPPTLAGVLAS